MTQTIELAKWHDPADDIPSTLYSSVYGELIKLAMPIIKEYHGDLYYDAQWVEKWLEELATTSEPFYYGVRVSGTHIGTDGNIIADHNTGVYKLTIYNLDSIWYVDIETLRTHDTQPDAPYLGDDA